VYCEIHPFNNPPVLSERFKGVILSGSPYSVRDSDAPDPDLSTIKGKLPLLGICYGAQFLSQSFGGEVLPSKTREYGRANLEFIDHDDDLFRDISLGTQVWMSHGDTIATVPENFKITASTREVKVGGFRVNNEQTFGIQFHPEVYHTVEGKQFLRGLNLL